MTARTIERERTPLWLHEHWLANCEQFRVERAGETLGFVEEIECTDEGEVVSLVVVAIGGGRISVDSAEVADVDPSRSLLVLDS